MPPAAAGHSREDDDAPGGRGRVNLPLVPVLAALLVLLLAVGGVAVVHPAGGLRGDHGDYVEVLQAARSGVVT